MKVQGLFRMTAGLLVLMAVTMGAAPPALGQAVESPWLKGGGGPGPMFPGFTYQGQLRSSGSPVTGQCDFVFTLWDSGTVGTQIGLDIQLPNVTVTNGLFTVVLNSLGEFDPAGAAAFQGDVRYLQTAARCPAGAGTLIPFSPRQILYAAPYAMGLVPGTRMLGASYQTLKIQNSTTVTGIPAGVTGEIKFSVDGVGVYGSNEVSTAGASGMGVWGRTFSPNGSGVKGTGANGGVGVSAVGNGSSADHPALSAVNTSALGVAFSAWNTSADATIVARNTLTGDIFHGMNAAGNLIVFSVTNEGKLWAREAQIGVGDLTVWGQIISGSPQVAPAGSIESFVARGSNSGISLEDRSNVADRWVVYANNGALRFYNGGFDRASFSGTGVLTLGALGAAGGSAVCRNASNQLAACSSSLRYKSHVADLDLGLETVARMRPVTFAWKETGEPDLGFVAEEMDQVTPLLTTRDATGQIEGVKYDRIGAVLVKAMQEQQQQISDLQTLNAALADKNLALEARFNALEQALITALRAAPLPAPPPGRDSGGGRRN